MGWWWWGVANEERMGVVRVVRATDRRRSRGTGLREYGQIRVRYSDTGIAPLPAGSGVLRGGRATWVCAIAHTHTQALGVYMYMMRIILYIYTYINPGVFQPAVGPDPEPERHRRLRRPGRRPRRRPAEAEEGGGAGREHGEGAGGEVDRRAPAYNSIIIVKLCGISIIIAYL